MNPLTKVKLINELNEREAHLGIKDTVSWHSEYKDSAWIFIGGFPYELTEGDIVCVFSQYGEIANINLVRDKKTGKSKGFCFLCYEDQRSTILAVDNLNGIKIKGRTLRVDHVANYRPPKDSEDIDDVTKRLRMEGCAPKLASSSESEDEHLLPIKKPKKDKKEKKKKKKEKKEKKKEAKEERRAAQTDPSHPTPGASVKKEKEDAGYEKYTLKGAPETKSTRERSAEDQRRGERVRERDERRTGAGSDGDEVRGKDEQSARENRERERWKERQRERDRNGDRERDGDRNNRDREKWRDREYRRN